MHGESWKRSPNAVCTSTPRYTRGPAGGREGCPEEGTLGSVLRGEEIQEGPSCTQERGLWAIGTARVRKFKKPGWSFRSAQRNLYLTPGQGAPGEGQKVMSPRQIGPSWHKAKGLHGKGVTVSIFSQLWMCPPHPWGKESGWALHTISTAISTTWVDLRLVGGSDKDKHLIPHGQPSPRSILPFTSLPGSSIASRLLLSAAQPQS